MRKLVYRTVCFLFLDSEKSAECNGFTAFFMFFFDKLQSLKKTRENEKIRKHFSQPAIVFLVLNNYPCITLKGNA